MIVHRMIVRILQMLKFSSPILMRAMMKQNFGLVVAPMMEMMMSGYVACPRMWNVSCTGDALMLEIPFEQLKNYPFVCEYCLNGYK